MEEYYSDKHKQLIEDWVAHEAAGAPDDFYAEYLLSKLDIYDKLTGVPARKNTSREDLMEDRRQELQIRYEAAARQGFPLGPIPKVY